jgi:hypothetical protein
MQDGIGVDEPPNDLFDHVAQPPLAGYNRARDMGSG